MGNFIVLAIVILLVAFGVRSIYKKRKEGGGCGCGCSSCGSDHCSHTHE